MVKLNKDGSVVLVNPPETAIARRQDAPIVYDITTICYALNPKFIMTHDSLFSGIVKAVEVPIERAIDIDNLFDFQVAESLLNLKNTLLANETEVK
jgi:N-acylneuraminate cytidylyltransferase